MSSAWHEIKVTEKLCWVKAYDCIKSAKNWRDRAMYRHGPCHMDNVHSGSKRLYFECDSEQVKEQDF